MPPKNHHFAWEIYPAPYQIGEGPVPYGVIIPINPNEPTKRIDNGWSISCGKRFVATPKKSGNNATVWAVTLAKK